MSKETENVRKEEIINSCEELYKNTSFKEITIKLISEKTSFSRPSIYNYFNTKEEIFLALVTKEYYKWMEDLNRILKKEKLSKIEFSDELAHSLEKRINLLKLISVNMYEMEENSSIECVTEFKKAYGKTIEIVKKCLIKFFKEMGDKEVEKFIYTFFPFMIGIYPYAVVTDKKREAMEKANVHYEYYSLFEIANMGIKKMLGV
ncbi:MAG: TetR family transcriptional regulator [Clostridia bacterium]|nr:TetR family transcriptional regulator [Clostridia bacterium]